MKFGMYIMGPEPISTGNFINPSHQSVCLYVLPLSLLGNGSVTTLLRQRIHTRNNRRIVGRVVFNAVRAVSKERRRLVIPRTSCFKIRKVH
jgi:hypothetical protein